MVYQLSAPSAIVTPTIEGMAVHDPADPAGTLVNYRFGQLGRSDSYDLVGESQQFEGRQFPTVTFGANESQVVSFAVDIPNGPDQRAEINRLRTLASSRKTLCYRDGRGRKLYGVIVGFRQTDDRAAVTVSIDVRRVNYSEGETLSESVPIFSNFDFRYVRQNDPVRTEVYDAHGWAATFTDGCWSVLFRGPARTWSSGDCFVPFSDTFHKIRPSVSAPATGWGPGGSANWSHSVTASNSTTAFTCEDGAGLATIADVNTSYRSLLNVQLRNPVFIRKFKVDKMPTGPAGVILSCGVYLNYVSSTNYYYARAGLLADGSVSARIDKNENNNTDPITSAVTALSAGSVTVGAVIVVKGEVTVGGIVRSKVWLNGTTEPGTWTCSAGDTTFTEGKVGCRDFAVTGTSNLPIVARTTYAEVVSATLASPVIVTHNEYLADLDLPFTGDAPVHAEWLRAHLLDPLGAGPEFGDIAWSYTGNQPLVYDDTDPTLLLAGDAHYGPRYVVGRAWDVSHADDGTLQEGSDGSDFFQRTITYPNGDVDAHEVHQAQALDCSGYVREVRGWRMGKPLTTDTTPSGLPFDSDPDRTAIPRVSYNIAQNAPGIIVAQGNPPTLDKLRFGDIVFFDADQSNPDEQEGQVDHVGMFWGRDQFGNYVFISSRKTVDGPTISNTGGASILNGTGLYARTLRGYRRL